MTFNNPRPGYQHASEFQTPGWPWVSSSIFTPTPTSISFPKAIRSFTIRNLDSSNPLRFGFTENGIQNGFFFEIPAGTSERFEVRTKVLWFQAPDGFVTGSLFAEQTLVAARDFPLFTGSSVGDAAGKNWPGVG